MGASYFDFDFDVKTTPRGNRLGGAGCPGSSRSGAGGAGGSGHCAAGAGAAAGAAAGGGLPGRRPARMLIVPRQRPRRCTSTKQ